jgi:hypothetical protein
MGRTKDNDMQPSTIADFTDEDGIVYTDIEVIVQLDGDLLRHRQTGGTRYSLR